MKISNYFDCYLTACIESEFTNIELLKKLYFRFPQYIGFINMRIAKSQLMIKRFSQLYYILFGEDDGYNITDDNIEYDDLVINHVFFDGAYTRKILDKKIGHSNYKLEKRLAKYILATGDKKIKIFTNVYPIKEWYNPLSINAITEDFLYTIHNNKTLI